MNHDSRINWPNQVSNSQSNKGYFSIKVDTPQLLHNCSYAVDGLSGMVALYGPKEP